MRKSKRPVRIVELIVLASLILLVLLLQAYPQWVELYYSQRAYHAIGLLLRYVFGWIPFSVGDTLSLILGIWLLIKLVKGIRQIIAGKANWRATGIYLLHVLRWGAWIYLLFMFCWGLNYYRLGTGTLLKLSPARYEKADAEALQQALLHRLQILSRDSVLIEELITDNREALVGEALEGYRRTQQVLHTGNFGLPAFKPHLIGRLQSYMGYAGYYFPFTGEAHANLNAPSHSLPYTVAHEMAHQAGFAMESEANLVAYLVNRESDNAFVRYSTYYALYHYALAEHYRMDSTAARQIDMAIPAMVKADRLKMKAFAYAHRNPFQPVLDAVYTQYLQWNKQPEGLEAYNRIVAWLIAYAKQYGWEKL